MVLEEASLSEEPSSESFSETLPSSDIDPYSGDRTPVVLSTRDPSYLRVSPPGVADPVYVNLATLPKQWGVLGSRSHPPQLLNAIADSCQMAGQVLGRPVRQEEADALAYHFAKSVRIGSYGTPVGVSVGAVMAYRSMSTYRFPGWTPGDKWRAKGYPDVFGPLKGARARAMWQITRFNIYGFLGAMMGTIFFGSYALTVGSAGRMMDPRLKQLSEKIRTRVKNGESGELLPGKREMDTTAGPRPGETIDMARQRHRTQERYKRNSQQKPQDETDDMSPTGGFSEEQYINAGNQGDMGMMSDEEVASSNRQRRLQESVNQRNTPSSSTTRRIASQTQPVDDASPMAATEPTPGGSGSAWERLRQQAVSGARSEQSTRVSSRGSIDSPSDGDSFNFSTREERQQLERTTAQKDFDARIEREREGRDFDDSAASRSGWRR